MYMQITCLIIISKKSIDVLIALMHNVHYLTDDYYFSSRSAVCIGCVRAMSSWFSHILDYEPYDPGVHSWLLNFRGG